MLVAFARYSRENSFQALRDNKPFVLAMTLGSIGGLLLGVIPTLVRILLLVLLLLSAAKSGDTHNPGVVHRPTVGGGHHQTGTQSFRLALCRSPTRRGLNF